MLFLPAFYTAINILRITSQFVFSLDHQKIGIVLNILIVNGIGMTFTERKIINGIQQVGFAHAVITDKTVDFCRKIQVGLTDVFIIEYGKRI